MESSILGPLSDTGAGLAWLSRSMKQFARTSDQQLCFFVSFLRMTINVLMWGKVLTQNAKLSIKFDYCHFPS